MFRGSRDALRATLARQFRQRENKTPNAGALGDALTALQGEALDADPVPVHLRMAYHRGKIVVDGPVREILVESALSDLFGHPLQLSERDGYYNLW